MKRKRRTGLIIFSILVIIVVVGIGGIIHQRFDKTSTKTVRLGLVGTDSEPVWDNVRKRLKKQGINIEYVVFNDAAKPYVNIIAVQEKNKDNKVYKEIVKAYQTEQTEKAINKTYKGAQEAAWPIYGRN